MGPLVWVGLGIVGGLFLAYIVAVGHWMTHAEVGVDPFDSLPAFDEDEAQQLLDAGA